MSKGEIKSLSCEGDYNDIKVRLIRHKTVEDMRLEIKEKFLDEYKLELEGDLNCKFAFTVGIYVEGRPEIIVFIPLCVKGDDFYEAISHEATHAALGIIRHDLLGKMHATTPVNVSGPKDDPFSINEEWLATIVGQLSKHLQTMAHSVKRHATQVAFAHGLAFYGDQARS